MEYNVRVEFSKNRVYPEYGPNAYSIESHAVLIPCGRGKRFSKSKYAVDYALSKIDEKVLSLFDRISIFTLRGGSGTGKYLKDSHKKSDATPIDKEFINSLFDL